MEYWAMVSLTLTMSAALALQFFTWLWGVSPRAFLILVGLGLLIYSIYLLWGTRIISLFKRVRQLWISKF